MTLQVQLSNAGIDTIDNGASLPIRSFYQTGLWSDSSRQCCRPQLFFFQRTFAPKFCLVFYVSWSCSQAIATAGAPQSFPIYEYLTDLAPLLTYCVTPCTSLFLRPMSNTNPLTCHLELSILSTLFTQNVLIKYFENSQRYSI